MSLLDILRERPEDLLLPDETVAKNVLNRLKESLDPVAGAYSPLDAIHVDGLKAEQVWVQVQMVLEGVSAQLAGVLVPESASADAASSAGASSSDDEVDARLPAAEGDVEGFDEDDADVVEFGREDGEDSEGVDSADDLVDDFAADDDDVETMEAVEIADDDAEDDAGESDDDEFEPESASLRDEGAGASDDEASDEARPKASGASAPARREDEFDIAEFQQHVLQLENLDDEDIDEDDEIDYSKAVEGSDSDVDVRFDDFFAPPKKTSAPPKKARRVHFADSPPRAEPVRPLEDDEAGSDGLDEADFDEAELDEAELDEAEHDEAEPTALDEALDADLDDVAAATRRDLFSDDESEEPASLSQFEQQQRELAQQIAQLEEENVGEKAWGMRGEISARERPEESLVSAEIEFERNAKPAPVITEESTQSLEDLIRERVRKQQFDDLPRRSEAAAPAARAELPALSEAKSQQSLAELYEADQQRAANPGFYAGQEAAVRTQAHREVADLFAQVSHALDALSSYQYTPRAPVPSVSIATDAPASAVEDAQPGTLADAAQRAPQEVYKDTAAPMASAEMSASHKRRRRREKARKHKAAAPAPGSKDEMFNTLKQGNVTLVDKRGTKRDLRGNKRTEFDANASFIKL